MNFPSPPLAEDLIRFPITAQCGMGLPCAPGSIQTRGSANFPQPPPSSGNVTFTARLQLGVQLWRG